MLFTTTRMPGLCKITPNAGNSGPQNQPRGSDPRFPRQYERVFIFSRELVIQFCPSQSCYMGKNAVLKGGSCLQNAGAKEIRVDRKGENLCDSCAFRDACATKERVADRYRVPTSNVRMSKCSKFVPSDVKKAIYRRIKQIVAPPR